MEVKLRSETIPMFRREMITMGLGGLFVPAAFVSDDQMLSEVVPAKGYLPLVHVQKLEHSAVLQLSRDLLHGIRDAGKYGFIEGEYYVSRKTAFLAKKEKRIQILYLPYHYVKRSDFRDGLCEILQELSRCASKIEKEYLLTLQRFLKEEKRSIRSAASIADKLLNESNCL